MVSINYSSREVCCKIVYYGPGLSGKTTNLQYVHAKVPGNTRGELISLATEADRTLYFDFLPINIGTINGFAAKFQLYTVPGQVYYNATRKLVLRGVDGIVFVADSQPDKLDENIESLVNLEENLVEYGYDIDDLPVVIQYNKRDLPGVMPVQELNARLNRKGWPTFEASATVGNGVFGTLKLIIKLVLDKAKQTSAPEPPPVASPKETVGVSSGPVAPDTAAPTGTVSPAAAASPSPEPQPPAEVVGDKDESGTVSPPQVMPEGQADGYRPYPGERQVESASKKISTSSFAPTRKNESEEAALGKNVVKPEDDGQEATPSRMSTPTMAPPLRHRGGTRKRGFFKRLFGVR